MQRQHRLGSLVTVVEFIFRSPPPHSPRPPSKTAHRFLKELEAEKQTTTTTTKYFRSSCRFFGTKSAGAKMIDEQPMNDDVDGRANHTQANDSGPAQASVAPATVEDFNDMLPDPEDRAEGWTAADEAALAQAWEDHPIRAAVDQRCQGLTTDSAELALWRNNGRTNGLSPDIHHLGRQGHGCRARRRGLR